MKPVRTIKKGSKAVLRKSGSVAREDVMMQRCIGEIQRGIKTLLFEILWEWIKSECHARTCIHAVCMLHIPWETGGDFFPTAGDRRGRKATASQPAGLLDITQCQTKCITGHGLELTFKT